MTEILNTVATCLTKGGNEMNGRVIKRLVLDLFLCLTFLFGSALALGQTEQKQILNCEAIIKQVQQDLQKEPTLPNQKERLGLFLSLLKQYQTSPNIELREKETGWSLLTFASYSGYTNVVTDLLSAGAKVNAGGRGGDTALTIATVLGHTDVVKVLLSAKADLYAEDQNGMTAFIFAIGYGHADIIKEFISAGIDVNVKTKKYGLIPLVTAVENGNAIVVRDLLLAGADVNAQDSQGRTAAKLAAELNKADVVEVMGHDLDTLAREKNAMEVLDDNPVIKRIKQDLAKTTDGLRAQWLHNYLLIQRTYQSTQRYVPDKKGVTLLMYAAGAGYADVVKDLLSTGADVNEWSEAGWTALAFAAERGHTDVAKELLSAKADANKTKYRTPPLFLAAKNGHSDTVKALLSAGATFEQVEGGGGTVLQSAVEHTDMVKILLSAGIDVNATDGMRQTALIRASRLGYVETVKVLLTAGADVNLSDIDGRTALASAAGNRQTFNNNNFDAVKELLAAKADVNAKNKWGETALTAAIKNGNVDVIKELLTAGADINATNTQGKTPLMIAEGRIEVIKVLLSAMADVNAKDKDGNTALSLAKNPEIINLLRDAGAKE